MQKSKINKKLKSVIIVFLITSVTFSSFFITQKDIYVIANPTGSGSEPVFGTPTIGNGSTVTSSSLSWSIPITDDEGDYVKYYINCSNGQETNETQPAFNTPSLPDTGDDFTLKWSADTYDDLHVEPYSYPSIIDVDGDGYQEVFLGGKTRPDFDIQATTENITFVSINGSTGDPIWWFNQTTGRGMGSSDNNNYFPMVYDFNDTNPGYEIISSCGIGYQHCLDADTGAVVWNVSSFDTGWHQQAYVDDGTDVYYYAVDGTTDAEGIAKVYANNGTVIKYRPFEYTCWGGFSIADVDNDGNVDIFVGGRYNNGTMRLDKDLNTIWENTDVKVSSQSVFLVDCIGDSDLEVVTCDQLGDKKLYILNSTNGNTLDVSSTTESWHCQPAVGQTQTTDDYQIVTSDDSSDPATIYNLSTGERIQVLQLTGGDTDSMMPPMIMDLLPDENDLNEILIGAQNGADTQIWRWNVTSSAYENVNFTSDGHLNTPSDSRFPNNAVDTLSWAVLSDVDYDGYKELICYRIYITSVNTLFCYETNMPVDDTPADNSIEFGSFTRLKNDEYIEPFGEPHLPVYNTNNGTKTLSLTDLSDGEYTVWVNATDGETWTREWFTFTKSSSGISNENWWNTSFGKRSLVKIDKDYFGTTLTNFPVLISTDSSIDLSTYAQSDGDDICFVLYSDNTTQLNHEIESYSSGTLNAWVNLTSISSSEDTYIWMYFNNSDASNQENIVGTWNSGYEGVWHCGGDGTDDLEDSTSHSNDADADTDSISTVTGIVSSGRNSTNGEEFAISSVPTDLIPNDDSFVYEYWIKSDLGSGGSSHPIMQTGVGASDMWYTAFNNGGFILRDDVPNQVTNYHETQIQDGTWHHVVGVLNRTSNQAELWHDGAKESSPSSIVTVGNINANGAFYLIRTGDSGYMAMDEIRISSVLRNDSWINATYQIMANNSDVISIADAMDIPSWHNRSFSYRKLITIDSEQIDKDLENFPILVSLNGDSNISSNAQVDGDDILFVLHSNNTSLAHEIEYFNKPAGNMDAWVKIPNLNSELDTKIWMYYGNGSCGSQESVTDVWDSNYVAVWHGEMDGSNDLIDSTSGGHDLANVGSPSEITTGAKVGYAVEVLTGNYFDGGDDSDFNFSTNDFTIETWFYSDDSPGSYHDIITKYASSSNGYFLNFYRGGTGVGPMLRAGSGTLQRALSDDNTGNYWDETWYYFYGMKTSTDLDVYVNTSHDDNANYNNENVDTTASIQVGHGGATNTTDCILDEMRISSIARSEHWMNTTYRTMNNTDTFITLGSEESNEEDDPYTGSNYYVSNSGSDNNNGSIIAPWKTISKVNTELDDGVIEIGDNIYFNRGDVFTTALNIRVGGTSGDWMVIGAYGSGAIPKFNYSASSNIIFREHDVDYIRFENLSLENSTANAITSTYNSTNVIVSNVIVRNTGHNGIYFDNTIELLIKNCTLINIDHSGIVLYGSEFNRLSNVTIENTFINGSGTEDAITVHKSDVFHYDVGSNFLIRNVTATGFDEQGFDISSGENILLLDCEAYGNIDSSFVCGGYAKNITVINFYSHDEHVAADTTGFIIQQANQVIIRNTRIINSKYHYLIISNESENITIFNNDIVFSGENSRDSSMIDISPATATRQLTFKNNIIISYNQSEPTNKIVRYLSPSSLSNTNSNWSNNVWWRGTSVSGDERWWTDDNDYTDWEEWQAKDQVINEIRADPLIDDPKNNSWDLLTGSPAIDNGTYLTNTSGSGTGTEFVVDDASYFMDGYGLVSGDTIKVGSDDNLVITEVNYATETLTVNRSFTWADDENIHLSGYNGSAPDIGYLESVGTGWSSWNYRKLITIDSSYIDDNLVNFPLLIMETDTDLKNNATADGGDIAFVSYSDNLTQYNHEIEKYDSGTGQLVAWVNVTSVSSTSDTKLWMYYNNTECVDQWDIEGTWDSNYTFVQHLNESDSTATNHFKDSTSNNNDGTLVDTDGDSGTTTSGKIGNAFDFNGDADGIDMGIFNVDLPFTYMAWYKIGAMGASTNQGIVSSKYRQNGMYVGTGNDTNAAVNVSNAAYYTDGYAMNLDTWYFGAVTYDGETLKLYVSNNDEASISYNINTAPSGLTQADNYKIYIGATSTWDNSIGSPFDGIIDEVRKTNIALNGSYINATWENANDYSSFITLGLQDDGINNAPTINGIAPTNTATEVGLIPRLFVTVEDSNYDALNITFRTNATGTWGDIETRNNVAAGTNISTLNLSMDTIDTKYWWSVNITDGESWTNATYSFTSQTDNFIKKWENTEFTSGLETYSYPIAFDINGDGIMEIFHGGRTATGSRIYCLNGSTGDLIWTKDITTLQAYHVPMAIDDLNNDGTYELVHASGTTTTARNAEDGSIFWESSADSGWSVPAIADTDDNGLPYVYVGDNTGFDSPVTLSKLYGNNGTVAASSTAISYTCYGGVSIADLDRDGEFEIMMGDSGDSVCLDEDLNILWTTAAYTSESHCAVLINVTGDADLEVIMLDQSDSQDGLHIYYANGTVWRENADLWDDNCCHVQPSAYDIDKDGNVEIVVGQGGTYAHVFDVVNWVNDTDVERCSEPPDFGNVLGDSDLEIVSGAAYVDDAFDIYNSTYVNVDSIGGGADPIYSPYFIIQDIDGDGLNEIAMYGTGNNNFTVIDTLAEASTPGVRTDTWHYSERRQAAAIYIPKIGGKTTMTSPSQLDGATGVATSITSLTIDINEPNGDDITWSIETSPNIGSASGSGESNGTKSCTVSGLVASTEYTWYINSSDTVNHNNTELTFTTAGGEYLGPDFYVSTTGSDSNNGSIDHPWLTIQKAFDDVVAGNTVYIREGIYTGRNVPWDMNDGASDNWITFCGYPGETAIVDGTGETYTWSGLFWLSGTKYIHIYNLTFRNASSHGIMIGNGEGSTNNITIDNCTFYNCSDAGVLTTAGDNTTVDDIIVENNTFYDCGNSWNYEAGQEVISIRCTNRFTIQYNHLYNIPRLMIDAKSNSHNGLIQYNTLNTTHADADTYGVNAIYVDAGIWYYTCDNITIQNNNIWGNGTAITTSTEQGGQLDNITIINNLCNMTDGHGYQINNHTSVNPGGGNHTKKTILVSNNNFLNCTIGFQLTDLNGTLTNFTFQNNIITGDIGINIGSGHTDLSYQTVRNNLFNVTSSYGYWSGNQINGSTHFVDPNNGNYNLSSNSDAIDVGSAVWAPSVDYFGNSRPQGSGYDIGAIESPFSIYDPPTIEWEAPTPTDASTQSETYVHLNTTITDTLDTSAFFDWNGSLLGYWNFENYDSEGVFDNSSYGSKALFSTLTESDIVDSTFGHGIDIGGSPEYLHIADSDHLNVTGNLTITLWVKPGVNASRVWVMKGDTIDDYNYEFGHHANGGLYFGVGDDPGEYGISPNSEVGDYLGEWMFCVVTVSNGTDVKLYKDAVLVKSFSMTADVVEPCVGDLYFGCESGTSYYDVSVLDEIRIFDRVISLEEINASYNNSEHRLQNNFTGLSEREYNYTAYAINTEGLLTTADRSVTVFSEDQLSEWSHRDSFTIDSDYVQSTLTDFPVLVTLTSNSNLTNYPQNDFDDIIFTNSSVSWTTDDITTRLSHEIESYNSTTGNLTAWVKLPTVSNSSDTTFYMYYGNSDCSNQEQINDVWSNGFVAVQHMEETSGNYIDSTINNNTGYPNNLTGYGHEGQIDGSAWFDGSNDCGINISNSSSLNSLTTSGTVSTWFYVNTSKAYGGIVHRGDLRWSDEEFTLQEFEGPLQFSILNNSNTITLKSDSDLQASTLYYGVGTWNDTGVWLYVDGSISNNTTSTLVCGRTTKGNLNIGKQLNQNNSDSYHHDGYIDEVRLSNVSRNESWIYASYVNQKYLSSFFVQDTEIEIGNESPGDDTRNISSQPTCSIQVSNENSVPLKITFASNYTGSWVNHQSNSTSTDGETITWEFSGAANNYTMYWWKVYYDDGLANNSQTYSFTTGFSSSFDMAIIAHETFYEYDSTWDLQRLADWHNENDTISAAVINMSQIFLDSSNWVNGPYGDANASNPFKRADEDVISNLALFNDSQAQIRNFIKYLNYEYGVEYVLLGGNINYLPIRYLFANSSGAPALTLADYTDLVPSDMYYGCLNGSFNADEDENSVAQFSGWGENATETGDIDEAWWNYSVAIGRFPCKDTTGLLNMVHKTITYLEVPTDASYLRNVTLAGMGGGWSGDTLWLANYSKTLNGTYTWWDGETTTGFNSTWNISILDSNPDRTEGEPFYDVNSRGKFNNGTHIWYQASHGTASGWYNSAGEGENFQSTDIAALTNTEMPTLVLSSLPCLTADMESDLDCFAVDFLEDEAGAFAGVFNTKYGWGNYDDASHGYDGLNGSSHYIGSKTIHHWITGNVTRIGDMVFEAKKSAPNWEDPKPDSSMRWATFEQILLGDPSVELKTPDPIEIPSKMGITLSETEISVDDTFNVTIWLNASESCDGFFIDVFNWTQGKANASSVAAGWWSNWFDEGTINNSTGMIENIQGGNDTKTTVNHTICTISMTAKEAGTIYFNLSGVEIYNGGPEIEDLTTFNTFTTISSVTLEVTNPYPANSATSIERPPINLSAYVEGTSLSVYIYFKNITGTAYSWDLVESWLDSSTSRHVYSTFSTDYSISEFAFGNTTYTWSVNASNGNSWSNHTYTYTTNATTPGGANARYDVSNNNAVNVQDALYVWNNRYGEATYNRIYDVSDNGDVMVQDALYVWNGRE